VKHDDDEKAGYPLAPEESDARPADLPGDVGLEDTDAPKVALDRARLLAKDRGEVRRGAAQVARAKERSRARRRSSGSGESTLSGPGEDPRDPVGLGKALTSLIRSRGWRDPVAVGSVLSRWNEIVGESVAAHSVPESFENAVVTVKCDSTAWATQLRLIQHDVLKLWVTESSPRSWSLDPMDPAGNEDHVRHRVEGAPGTPTGEYSAQLAMTATVDVAERTAPWEPRLSRSVLAEWGV
jgi:predicted nucleic acid-binding Zn ribbon protein